MPLHPELPIPESYWVQRQLLAGGYPIQVGDAEPGIRQRMHRFLAIGISCFVDLTEAHEFVPYLPFLMAEVSGEVCPPAYHQLSIRNWDIPTPALMAQILDTIDAAVAEGYSVYVHCAGGIGRTGTVVGCYLVRHGMRGDAALEELVRLRHTLPISGALSPRREPQRQMVRTWPIGR